MKVGVYEAKSKLSEMIKLAREGEDVVITKNGEDMVRLTPLQKKKRDWIGMYAGQIKIHDSFYDPMTEEELALFYGGDK
jgi:prevent-host-death family protein